MVISSFDYWTFIMRSWILLVLLSVFCLSCSSAHRMETPWDVKDYAPYTEAGTASIEGRTLLKRRDGGVRPGAGNTVYLIPATTYTGEYVHQTVRMGRAVSNYKAPPKEAVRTATADADGRFTFTGLPAGEYYLLSDFAGRAADDGTPQPAGLALEKVYIATGQQITGVMVSR
jgi:hypothetical protein